MILAELTGAASSMISDEIPGGTLSLHRGTWLKTQNFHAHLCVDVDHYLNVFNAMEDIIPNWPNQQYVTKKWKVNDDPASYPENVHGHLYPSYVNDEVEFINNHLLEVPAIEMPDIGDDAIMYVFHPRHPKIGFVGNAT